MTKTANTVKEIQALGNAQLIAEIFYMGIGMSSTKPLKKMETKLQRLCKECERRGFVEDGNDLYARVCE